MNGNKKILALAVLCAVASVGFVLPASAEETMQHDLDEVIVEADRDALPGGLVRTTAGLVSWAIKVSWIFLIPK